MPALEPMAPWYLFLKGIAVGFSIAAPVGPTTVLVIHRTIKQRFRTGVLSGFGAAAADALFGFIAAYGVSFIASTIFSHEDALRLIGGTFLLFWGWKIYGSRFAETDPLLRGEGWGGPFLSTFLLTLTNPMTVLAFMAILAGLGGSDIHEHSLNVVGWLAGIGTGSFAWWLALSVTAYRYRSSFGPAAVQWMNRVTGVIVAGAGLYALWGLRHYGRH